MPSLDEIDFRESTTGGGVDRTKPWIDSERLRGQEHLVVLLHGYNNTRDAASASYAAFRNLQQDLAGQGQDWAPGATVVAVYWPGDADWGLLSAAYYPFAVPRAQQVASILGGILTDLSSYTSSRLAVDFVAHSLGNRLLLRTLALCTGATGLWVRRVVHMAAAVPTWKLEDSSEPDKLASGLTREIGPDGDTLSLFSRNDLVLKLAFPVGETFTSADDGFFPTALGHEEWSGAYDLAGFSQAEARGAGHGDYWGAERSTPAELTDFVSREVQRQLQLGAAGGRATPASLTLSAAGSPDRVVDGGRELNSRSTAPARGVDGA